MRVSLFRNARELGTYDAVLADIRAAELQGLARYWIPSPPSGPDGLALAAAAAMETSAIDLAVGVVPVPPRHPMVFAQQALTVAGLAEGRLTLGLGMSVKPMIERIWGLPPIRPRTRLIQFLEVLRPLLAGEPVDVQNSAYSVRGRLDLQPTAPPSLYLAAMGPQMAATAAALADGLFTWMAGPAALRDIIRPAAQRGADASERPMPKITCAVPVCVTADSARALDRADELFGAYAGHPSSPRLLGADGHDRPGQFAIIGAIGEVQERLRGYQEAGADEIAVTCFGSTPAETEATREIVGSGQLLK